ncbi:MAG: hypothetical protein KIS77_09850 [Saprospiraceae bacterium]|nr:hypothetical protein [Saprospiraceae bacterium]
MQNTTHSLTKATLILAAAIALLLSLPACQKCETLEQVVTPPPARCGGAFYALKSESGVNLAFSLHEFAKPVPEPFASVSKAGPFGVPTMLGFIRSNFSAYDSTSRRYVYWHYYGTGDQFFSFNAGSGLPTLTPGPRIDVCPVFHKGRLHTIYAEQFSASEWFYSINEVNPITGLDGVGLIGNSATTNSPLRPEYMSAVSTGGDLFYFLSGTNLIEVNLNANTSRHIDIDRSYHPIDNIVQYFGLEYKRDEGVLLAMRNTNNATTGEVKTTLVSIRVTSGDPVVTTLFDISAGLPAGPERFVNPEFYSSAFDPCDNTYYATSKRGLEIITTRFIEVNLPKNEMKQRVLDGYWYGLEFAGR